LPDPKKIAESKYFSYSRINYLLTFNAPCAFLIPVYMARYVVFLSETITPMM